MRDQISIRRDEPVFIAHGVSIGEDEDCWTLGLADDLDNPGHYLIIQRNRSFDDQDRALGMDNLHYEFDDQLNGFYGGVSRIQLGPSTLRLWIDEQLACSRGLAAQVNIELAITPKQWEELRNGLRSITESLVHLEETSIGS